MNPVKKTSFLVYLQSEPDLFVHPLLTLSRHSRVEDVLKVAELATGLPAKWQKIYYIDECDLNPMRRLCDLHVVHQSSFTTRLSDDLAQFLCDIRGCDMRKIAIHGLTVNRAIGDEESILESTNWRTRRNRLAVAWMAAAGCGLQDVCASLISLGAELNTTTSYGRTAVHIAAAHGYIGVLQLLAQKGADLCATDCDGLNPLAIAHTFGHLAFARHLNRLNWSIRVRGMQPRFLNPPLKAFQMCDSTYPKWRSDLDGRIFLQKTTKLQTFAGNGLDAPAWKWPDLEVISARKRHFLSKHAKEKPPLTIAYTAHCTRLNKQHQSRLYPLRSQ